VVSPMLVSSTPLSSIPNALPNYLQSLVAFLLHQLTRISLDVQTQQRLRVRGPYAEPPIRIRDRDAVHLVKMPIGEGFLHTVEGGRDVRELRGYLAAAGAGAQTGDERGDGLALLRDDLQGVHQGDEAGIGIPELPKIEVPRVLGAEDSVVLMHR